jgi:hypothetical protein
LRDDPKVGISGSMRHLVLRVLAMAATTLPPVQAWAERDLSDHGRGWTSGTYWTLPVLAVVIVTFIFVMRRIRTRRARRGLGPGREPVKSPHRL